MVFGPREERAARTIQRILVRECCPITLCPIRHPFVLRRHGVSLRFEREALFDCVCLTGDSRDPIARQPMSGEEKRRLERECGRRMPPPHTLRAVRDQDVSRRQLLHHLLDDALTTSLERATVLDELRVVATREEWRWVRERLARVGIVPVPDTRLEEGFHGEWLVTVWDANAFPETSAEWPYQEEEEDGEGRG